VSTGLKELDDILGGWDMLNESAVVCARTGFGKSWWLIFFAMQAAKAGLRVGFYSGEMEIDLVGYRFDTFLGNIANGSLTHGNENVMVQYQNYIETLNKVVPGHIYCITPDMFDGSVTVSKLRAFIEKYDLQMLCVDQFSLLDDDKHARNPREQAVNISKDLRSLQRLKKLPILTAVQLNREESEDGPSTRNIAESDRIGQDATTVLFIERKGDNAQITVGKARNAKTGDKLTYSWNINMGILHYIPSETDALNGKDSEKLLEAYNDTDKSDSVF
jgi:replicative DNA helicase